MLEYYFVKIGCFHDYNRVLLDIEKEELKNDFCWFDNPKNVLKGFKLFFYKLINSQTVNRIIRMPFRMACTKYLIDEEYIKSHSKGRCVCFILTALNYRDGLIFKNLAFLRKHFHNCKAVFFLSDKVDYYKSIYKNFDLNQIKATFDCVYTYNGLDAKDYGLTLSPYLLYDFSGYNKSEIKYDAFFVGQDKGRLSELLQLAEQMVSLGLSISFNIIGVEEKNRIPTEGVNYCSYIPYIKVLEMISESKAIVNIMQSGATGVTLRDYEAISMRKILITDKNRMAATDFYTEEKVIDLENVEEELYKINEFDASSPWNNTGKYTVLNYYECLSKVLDSNGVDRNQGPEK